MTMYPPSPLRRSRYRPPAVPGFTGATTSKKLRPTGMRVFSSPKTPTPGSTKQRARPKTASKSCRTGSSRSATRAICLSWRVMVRLLASGVSDATLGGLAKPGKVEVIQ